MKDLQCGGRGLFQVTTRSPLQMLTAPTKELGRVGNEAGTSLIQVQDVTDAPVGCQPSCVYATVQAKRNHMTYSCPAIHLQRDCNI